MVWGAVVGGIASGVVGGMMNKDKSGGYASKAAKQYDNIQVPRIQEMMLELEQLVQQGIYTPEQAQAILQEQSAMEGIELDPQLMDAQLQALQQLQEMGETGSSAAGQAQLARIRSDQMANERGAREAIMQNAAMRGVGGSGMELASQLMNQQMSAGNRNLADLEVAAMEEQNRINAIQGAGNLGGSISDRQFGQQAQIAAARDAVNQFNTQARQEANYFNVGNRNTAQQQNLGERQRIADQNTNTRNMQQQYNKELQQQTFDNRMALASGRANALSSQANVAQQSQANRNQLIGGFMEAGAKVGSEWDNKSDVNVKKDISKIDPSDFLDELTGYKYKYKDSKHGEGDQVGIMAQDLEKVAPQAVREGEDGTLEVNFQKLGGPILAALSGLNERLNDLEDKK
jgi:hypothetical protein